MQRRHIILNLNKMKKIPSLFKRDYDGNRLVYDEIVEECDWVLKGEGTATKKYNGTAAMIRDGILYKRYDVKNDRKVPANAIPCEEKPNEHTRHWPHWLPVDKNKHEDKYFIEAFNKGLSDGTYELCGPKIQSNPEKFDSHTLILHGIITYNCPRNFEGIKNWLKDRDIEGIVWHHQDGRMCKIKKKDFGLKR